MEQAKLNKILDEHKLWLKTNGEQGKRADLRYADLQRSGRFRKVIYSVE